MLQYLCMPAKHLQLLRLFYKKFQKMMLAFSIGGTKRQALKGLGIHENRQQLLIQGMQGFVRMNTGVGERLPAAVLPHAHRLILMQVYLFPPAVYTEPAL